MKKHAFIFDMDGVLIDSQPVHYDADLETLAHFGVQLTRADVEPFAGTTNPVRFPMYQEAFRVQATPEEMMAYREGVVRRMFVESNAHAIKGTKELLENIHAAGYPVALASSTDP
ncbi:HAD family hydrolase, partial [Anaerotignum lactatifermentans]|uniref:HAD family hydrolase n=1 Tax=Anaerotignum lactatifermentans TaxID=160404 RepID=UPI003AB67DB9